MGDRAGRYTARARLLAAKFVFVLLIFSAKDLSVGWVECRLGFSYIPVITPEPLRAQMVRRYLWGFTGVSWMRTS